MTQVLLPEGATPHAGPVHFGAFPGVFYPGQSTEVPLDEERARDLIEKERLPLVIVGASKRATVADTLARLEGAGPGELRAALAAEQGHDEPRVSLVRELEARLQEADQLDNTGDLPEQAMYPAPGELPVGEDLDGPASGQGE